MRRTRKLALIYDILVSAKNHMRARRIYGFYKSFWGRPLWQGYRDEIIFVYPDALRPGLPERGELWLAGDYTLTGGIVRGQGKSPFALPAPSDTWLASLHSFDWLRHLRATQGTHGKTLAYKQVMAWVKSPSFKNNIAMRPDVVARRLMSWSSALADIQQMADSHDLEALHVSLTQQARWLSLVAPLAKDGLARLTAAIGMAFCGLMLAGATDTLRRGMDFLRHELRRQILSDGGHIGRTPESLAILLADLRAIEAGLSSRNIPAPSGFGETLRRMQEMLSLMRHQDGGLACFNGGLENSAAELTPLLRNFKKAPMSFAQRSGYQRLKAGNTCLLIDVGDNVSGADSLACHAAPLAFEMSHDNDRIIVNCGPNRVHDMAWQLAARGIAAHSTLGFERGMNDPFLRTGLAARRLGPRLRNADWQVNCRRVEDKTGIWLEISHGMFVSTHGVRHNRRIFMDTLGEDVRGEDLLLTDMNHHQDKGARFHLRFHLHPNVNASLQGGSGSVLLLTQSGHGWQFRMVADNDFEMSIEDSVYMGRRGVPQRCQQILVTGVLGHADTLLRWALRYVGRQRRRRMSR